MDSREDSVENTVALFQLAADLAGQGSAAVAIGSALFQGGKKEFLAYVSASAILAGASESQLRALKVYGNQLEKDIQALEDAKSQLDAFPSNPGVLGDAEQAGSLFLCDVDRAPRTVDQPAPACSFLLRQSHDLQPPPGSRSRNDAVQRIFGLEVSGGGDFT